MGSAFDDTDKAFGNWFASPGPPRCPLRPSGTGRATELLLPAPERESGQRSYPLEAAARITVLRPCQQAGLSLAEIREFQREQPRREAVIRAKITEIRQRMVELGHAHQLRARALRCGEEDFVRCPKFRQHMRRGRHRVRRCELRMAASPGAGVTAGRPLTLLSPTPSTHLDHDGPTCVIGSDMDHVDAERRFRLLVPGGAEYGADDRDRPVLGGRQSGARGPAGSASRSRAPALRHARRTRSAGLPGRRHSWRSAPSRQPSGGRHQ
ncbi:MerR family transcriptional regulator [Streptomyces sp. KLMMK]|uniref:MerR family DNA-binding protein n=1 Tax=Streptomyces sp. KLMMK TaxID=3109353 RepID=UPI003008A5B8